MILEELNFLTEHHKAQCKLYADFVNTMFFDEVATNLSEVPFLPVRAFKEFILKSVPDVDIYKVMRSSGTSGQYSQIFLDRMTAKKQTKSLVNIFGDHFGKGRFPMLIIDSESTVKDRLKFSARTAAINGFSMFARKRCFALNDNMELELDRVQRFIERQDGKPIFVFGFTFIIWQALIMNLKSKDINLPLQDAFFVHGGGWKKLEKEKVSNAKFKSSLYETTGSDKIHNYYGMVEQTGTIFMECSNGRLHASPQSTVLVRDPENHKILPHGKTGLIQVFSTIQTSYPGHSLLTEDIGRTSAAEDCSCRRSGIIVEIYGRLSQAEVRGCSDAYL
jgi:phenylacetate-coenzyme A ligase PaaK-like adenylate-forming protein